MPLTHTTDLFAKALKGKYALGAFNVNNMELLQAIIEACEEEKAPVMLQISKGARDYAHPVYLKKLIEAAVSLSTIPIAVHLDHGDSFELCKQCIDEGFTSVMIDASHEPFEKNVEITRKVVEYAHRHNCVVESELGHLVGAQFDDGEEGGAYSMGGHYTHPEEAVKFVKDYDAAGLRKAIPLMGSGFLTDGTLEAQGASAQGLITALHYGDNIETPRNNAFRNKFAVTYKANPDVYAMQGYDAAQLLGAGLQAVKGDDKKRTELIAAMKKAQVDSPRGKFTLSAQHNPTQDFYVREVKGLYNVVTGVAVKGLADPGRGCKM